jgi:hypothetical protein
MRITLVGSRHFGVTTLDMLRRHGVDVVRVVVADAEDRLAAQARAAGIEVSVQADPKFVVAGEIADGTIPRYCRGTAALRRSNGRFGRAIRSPGARSIIFPTGWTPARSRPRNGVS